MNDNLNKKVTKNIVNYIIVFFVGCLVMYAVIYFFPTIRLYHVIFLI